MEISFEAPVRPVARKVAEASLLPHSHIELPTSRAVGAERMEDKDVHIINNRQAIYKINGLRYILSDLDSKIDLLKDIDIDRA